MVKTALSAGIPWRDIGGMTAEEISVAAQVKQERYTEFSRLLAWLVYNGAALAGVAFNDPKRFPSIEDAFPTLFEKKEQQDWRVMKERVESYALKRQDEE